MSTPKLRTLVLTATASILLVILGYATWSRLHTYHKHELGISVTKEENFAGQLLFPAISICTWHYDMKVFNEDQGIVSLGSLFGGDDADAPTYTADPTIAYKRLQSEDDIVNFTRRYYLSLDNMFKKMLNLGLNPGCRIGEALCEVYTKPSWQNGDNSIAEFEVPAGKWTSRVMADSSKGFNMMCHTLAPNVSVDFTKSRGNVMELRWNNDLSRHLPQWHLYIHDRRELVTLKTYAMTDLPIMRFQKPTEETPLTHQAKAKLSPRLLLKEPTREHPCEDDDSYSQSHCLQMKFWKLRVDSIREYYGERFNCVIPGLLLKDPLSICTIATSGGERDLDDPNGTIKDEGIGYLDLINPHGTTGHASDPEKIPNLVDPPIGAEYGKLDSKKLHDGHQDNDGDSACLPRCEKFEYDATHEEEDEDGADVYIYFATQSVEVWREFEPYGVISMISDIGGLVGLLLGLSLYSIVEMIADLFEVWRQRKLGKSKKIMTEKT